MKNSTVETDQMVPARRISQDKVRKYKEKCLTAERTVVAQQREIHRMEEKSKVLQEALNAVGKSPKQVFDEQGILSQLEEKDKTIQVPASSLEVSHTNVLLRYGL